MPHTTSSPRRPSPSIKGSKPVSEVLGRIQVRHPPDKPSGLYGHRMADYESRAPILQAAVIFMLAAFTLGGIWSVSLQKLADLWNARPSSSSVVTRPQLPESLSIPENIHLLPY